MPKTVFFDVLGTLLDISAPVARYADQIGPEAIRLNDLWRAKQLEYAWVAALTDQYTPLWTLTARALDAALRSCGLDPTPIRDQLLSAYREPTAFPDAQSALSRLRAEGHQLVAFSNADERMLHDLVAAAGMTATLDAVLSTEPAKTYKPSPKAYALARKQAEACYWPADIAFVSSNPWDVFGAHSFGWSAYWVNRKRVSFEFQDVFAPPILGSLDELANHLAIEAGQ